MLYINLIGSFIFEILLSGSALNDSSDTINNPKWEFVEIKEDIAIYERWIQTDKDHKTRERKGEFQLNTEIEFPISLIRDEYEVPKWMNSAKSVEIIEDSGTSWISYITFEAPWPFKQRDLVAEFYLHMDLFNEKTIITVKAIPSLLPNKEDVIRIESYNASWEFQKNTSGLNAVFKAMSDTPPIVPRWIQDPITQKMFWESLDNFRSQVHEKTEINRNYPLHVELK